MQGTNLSLTDFGASSPRLKAGAPAPQSSVATELNKAMAGRSKGTRLWVQGRLHNKGKKSEGRAETRIVIQAFRILPEPEQVGESTATRLRELVRETTGGMT